MADRLPGRPRIVTDRHLTDAVLEGLHAAELARRLRVRPCTVSAAARRAGITLAPRVRGQGPTADQLREYERQGFKLRQVVDLTGLSYGVIWRACQRHGVRLLHGNTGGADAPDQSRDERVAWVRAGLRAGASIGEIAVRWGVSRQRVSQFIKRWIAPSTAEARLQEAPR